MMKVALVIAAALASVEGFVASPRPAWVRAGVAAQSPIAAVALGAREGPLVPAAATARVTRPAQMGLFGLGTPEIAIIAAVGLLVLGPDQVKKLAKDVGKVSAELKQVPEEFNKGVAVGQEELDKKKQMQASDGTAPAPSPPPTPPPAA